MAVPERRKQLLPIRSDATIVRLTALAQLRGLAERAAGYLRRSAAPAVRLSAALLLAASLAACDRAAELTEDVPAVIQPLGQEVVVGLPQQPGRYAVQPDSLSRDQRGVYELIWLEPGTNTPHLARTSRLQLAQADRVELELPAQGDPILYLPASIPIRLVDADVASATPTAGSAGSTTYVAPHYPIWALWHPFIAGTGASRPAYYDPPARTVEPGQRVEGGTASTTPKPFAERVTGLTTAVSGRAGGTGSGSAVTNKSGTGGKSGVTGVTAPKSSGFSSGRGVSGSIGAAS